MWWLLIPIQVVLSVPAFIAGTALGLVLGVVDFVWQLFLAAVYITVVLAITAVLFYLFYLFLLVLARFV
jgi:hypothetical protein